jgi:hypothetical protein
MYCELPFLRADSLECYGAPSAGYLQKRFNDLSAIVAKLEAEGWFVRLTLTGIAFSLTATVIARENLLHAGTLPTDEAVKEYIRQKFAALGIQEDFRCHASRSLLDLLKANVAHDDRVRYDEVEQDLRFSDSCEDLDETYEQFDELRELERLYGRRNLIMADSYERGLVHGRLQALRWVLGDEWDASQLSDIGADRFDAEVDKDEAIHDRGVTQLQGLLSGKAIERLSVADRQDWSELTLPLAPATGLAGDETLAKPLAGTTP